MQHIGITAHIKDFEVPLFVGYFKIKDGQDLRKTADIALQRYSDRKNWAEFFERIKTVEIYDRETNNELLTINL